MKLIRWSIAVVMPLFAAIGFNPAFADELIQPTPITAEEAYDAVQMQIDPLTGDPASVVLMDVRDPLEVFSSGAAAAVTEIEFSNRRGFVEPDWGKVRLVLNGKFITYRANGRYKWAKVGKIDALSTEPIAYNIKFWVRTETGWDVAYSVDPVDGFAPKILSFLQAEQPDVVILYCRTGGRSSYAGQLILNGKYTFKEKTYESGLFPSVYVHDVYEIDDPDRTNGRGGFTGSDYGKVFNGYAGFPGRLTYKQDVPSASWKDSGLPVVRATRELPQ